MALDRVSSAATNFAAAMPALARSAMTTVRRDSAPPGGGCRAVPMGAPPKVGPSAAGATGSTRILTVPPRRLKNLSLRSTTLQKSEVDGLHLRPQDSRRTLAVPAHRPGSPAPSRATGPEAPRSGGAGVRDGGGRT